MNKIKKIIADLARADIGTEAKLLETMFRLYNDIELENIFTVCLEHQHDSVVSKFAGLSTDVLDNLTHYTAVSEHIWNKYIYEMQNNTNSEDIVLVLTFHASVFSLYKSITPQKQHLFVFTTWSKIYKKLLNIEEKTPVIFPVSKQNISFESANNTQKSGKTRSDYFYEHLKKVGLGPFSLIREQLYENIEKDIQTSSDSNQTILLHQLIRDSIAQTKNYFIKQDETDKNKGYPWRGVKHFISTLLSKNSVFVDTHGNKVSYSVLTLNSELSEMIENWKRLCECELLIELVRHFKDISSINDIEEIAGVLYLDRNYENEQKVITLMQYLIKEQIFEVRDDHSLCLFESEN